MTTKNLIFCPWFYAPERPSIFRSIFHNQTVFPNLVIYHKLRDFGVSLRDRNFPSVRSHESPKSPRFWAISQILSKYPLFSHNLTQKVDFPKENYPKFSWPSNPITYANNSEIFTKEFQVNFTKKFCDNNFVKK